MSRTLGRFGRTSPSVRPHGGPHSRLVRPVAWQLARRRSPHTTPCRCCCNARLPQPAHRKASAEAFGVPSITVCPFAPTAAAESYFQSPPNGKNHQSCSTRSAFRCTVQCTPSDSRLYVGVACQWSSQPSFYSSDHVCSTGHEHEHKCSTATLVPLLSNPTYCLLRYCCCCSFISTSKSTTPCCHVFNAAVKKSHTRREEAMRAQS